MKLNLLQIRKRRTKKPWLLLPNKHGRRSKRDLRLRLRLLPRLLQPKKRDFVRKLRWKPSDLPRKKLINKPGDSRDKWQTFQTCQRRNKQHS